MEEEGEERGEIGTRRLGGGGGGGEGRNWYDSPTDRILNNNDGRWFINVNNRSTLESNCAVSRGSCIADHLP